MSDDALSDIVRAGYEQIARNALSKPLLFEQLAPKREGPPPPRPVATGHHALERIEHESIFGYEFDGYRLVLELGSGRKVSFTATGYECEGLDVELWETDGGA